MVMVLVLLPFSSLLVGQQHHLLMEVECLGVAIEVVTFKDKPSDLAPTG